MLVPIAQALLLKERSRCVSVVALIYVLFFLTARGLSGLVRSSPTARLSLNKSPLSESNASISIWASSSLEVVATARGPSSFRRPLAVFFQVRPQFRSFGISSVAGECWGPMFRITYLSRKFCVGKT